MRLFPRQVLLSLVVGLGVLVLWPVLPAGSENPAPLTARPALYEFGAGHCFSCIEMEKVMQEIKGRYGEQLEVRMVYVDKEKDLFQQYKILLIPTQVFLDASGKEVDRHIGPLSREEVLKKLRDLKFISK